MIVDVPCARIRPSVEQSWPCAEIICRPCETTRASARTRPVSGAMRREKFALVSIVVEPTPAGSKVCAAHAVTLSMMVVMAANVMAAPPPRIQAIRAPRSTSSCRKIDRWHQFSCGQ